MELREQGKWFLSGGVSLKTTAFEGQRQKDAERRFQRGSEPRPAQNWERSGHLQGKAPVLTMS